MSKELLTSRSNIIRHLLLASLLAIIASCAKTNTPQESITEEVSALNKEAIAADPNRADDVNPRYIPSEIGPQESESDNPPSISADTTATSSEISSADLPSEPSTTADDKSPEIVSNIPAANIDLAEDSEPTRTSEPEPLAGGKTGDDEIATLDERASDREAVDETDGEIAASPDSETDPNSENSSGDTSAEEVSPGTETTNIRDRQWRLVESRGTLRAGLDPTIGYAYLRTNPDALHYEGFEWDIFQAIAAELNVAIEPIYIPWAEQLNALRDNRVDIIFGGREAAGVNPKDFLTTAPYYLSPQRIVVRTQNSKEIRHLSDLFGQKVGIVADSAGAAILEVFNRDRANALHLVNSSNPSHLFEQLRQAQLDAVVIDQPIAVAEIERSVAHSSDPQHLQQPSSDKTDPSLNPDPTSAEERSPSEVSLAGNASTSASAVHSEASYDEASNQEEGRVRTASENRDLSSASLSTLHLPSQSASSGKSEPDGAGQLSVENASVSGPVPLSMVGEPMFPTPLVGIVKADHASLRQAIDGAIFNLERDGTIAAILEKWEL